MPFIAPIPQRYSACCPSPPFLSDILMMPAGKKRIRDAKQKQEGGCKQGCTTFAKHTMRPPSPNASDYHPPTLEDNLETLLSELDSSDDIGRKNEARMSMVALQCLYLDLSSPSLAAQ
jgi:hypothetical protein